jgi:hypothetical protein
MKGWFMNNEIQDDVIMDSHKDMMRLFNELSFKDKWKRVFKGLNSEKDSGDYKWARLQLFRLLSPIMALVVPVLMLFLIALLAQFTPTPTTSIQVKVIEPTPIEELEEIIPPEMDKLEPPDPIEVQMEFTMDSPAMPNDVASPTADSASVQPSEFDSVAQIKSPVVMAGIMGSRNPGSRGAALNRFGGGGHTELAVLNALRWLAKNQREDGSWGQTKVAMTSLALLAYLAHGDTPASDEFGSTVEKAIRFIIEAQEPDGRFKGRDGHDYTQPIAAYALAEAFGMTKVPMVRDAAAKAIRIVAKGQNSSGSFDYGLKPGGTQRDDLSYAAWCVQALKAASISGLYNDAPEIKNAMSNSIKGIKVHFKGNSEQGVFGYARGGGSAPGLTGAGVLCLQFLGDAKSRETKAGLASLNRWAFNWSSPPTGSIVYYWYYNTQAYFQEGGKIWDDWNLQFSRPLTTAQRVIPKEQSGYVDHKGVPHSIGSWVSPASSEKTGGNGEVMDTILCTLMLEVYYRYLPTFQQIPQDELTKELGGSDDLIIEIL